MPMLLWCLYIEINMKTVSGLSNNRWISPVVVHSQCREIHL